MLSTIDVVAIAGVRPQFIKMAALQRCIDRFNVTSDCMINARYINSGQHYDDALAGSITRELNIRFDFELAQSDPEPARMFGKMITGIYGILSTMRPVPQWVLVLGDANTAAAGALAAALGKQRVVHIEAGVRSGDLMVQEEINRRIVDHVSTVHFCSSRSGVSNLRREGISDHVFWTGDLAYEFFMEYSRVQPYGLGLSAEQGYILTALHKPANLNSDEVLVNLMKVLGEQRREVLVVMHPKCKTRLRELGLGSTEKITLVNPLQYSKMISAMKGCAFIVTDSGGIQREAYYLGKRCLVRRDSVGWSSLMKAGVHRLIGPGRESMHEGLEWIEHALANRNYESVNEFVRKKSCDYALNTLVRLGTTRSALI